MPDDDAKVVPIATPENPFANLPPPRPGLEIRRPIPSPPPPDDEPRRDRDAIP